MSGPGFQHAIDCTTPAPMLTATIAELAAARGFDGTTLRILRRLRARAAA